MNFGEALKYLRLKKGLKQNKFAELLGVGNSAISNYENSTSKPCYELFVKICNILESDANYFMQEDLKYFENQTQKYEQEIISSYHKLSESDRRVVDFILGIGTSTDENKSTIIYRLPIYNQDIAAGSGQFGIEQKPKFEDFHFDDSLDDVSYGVRIKGDSMETANENTIPDQSVVLITTNFDFNDLEKEAVIANIGGTLICKEYNIAEDGHLWLKSRNRKRANDDKHIHDINDVKILGRVIKVISNE